MSSPVDQANQRKPQGGADDEQEGVFDGDGEEEGVYDDDDDEEVVLGCQLSDIEDNYM